MTSQRVHIFLLCILCYSSTFSNSYVLLDHTENSPETQYHDCIYLTISSQHNNIQNVKYCRQFEEIQPLQRNFEQLCHNSGRLWLFEELADLNVSTSDVLRWSSSVEQANRYSRFLSNTSLTIDEKYACNCTNLASFGKFCEYEFYGGSTSFHDAVIKQFQPLSDFRTENYEVYVGSQLHNNRPCYKTWTCDSGLMCLDWRHICDGNKKQK